MLYIKQERRKLIDESLNDIFDYVLNETKILEKCNVGDLNYIITKIIHRWIKEKGLRYQNINAAIGVLECAKLELYRMIAALYEDKKKEENGFISELDRITDDEKQAI